VALHDDMNGRNLPTKGNLDLSRRNLYEYTNNSLYECNTAAHTLMNSCFPEMNS
jgi:hypothetical protein